MLEGWPALLGASDLQRIFWIAAALMLVVLLGVGGMYAARYVRSWSQRPLESVRFSLADLRAMRRAGSISDEEFEALRKLVIRDATAEPAGADQSDAPTPRDDRSAGDASSAA